MTKEEALQMCLEYIETDAHERKYVRHAIKQALEQPVQEPVAWMTQARNFVHVMEFTEAEAKLYGWIPVYTTPPAQPVIPDAMTSADIQEHIEYVAGWNDCRQAMMEMMK
jgi:hypothetical protein